MGIQNTVMEQFGDVNYANDEITTKEHKNAHKWDLMFWERSTPIFLCFLAALIKVSLPPRNSRYIKAWANKSNTTCSTLL